MTLVMGHIIKYIGDDQTLTRILKTCSINNEVLKDAVYKQSLLNGHGEVTCREKRQVIWGHFLRVVSTVLGVDWWWYRERLI